ncbi:hypothetical protein DPMN_193112 [Dreissena polymorpha]|uniref:Uncharacterized protein n=1 Tax=Dreissena polymorpha TaxID=45954 RepID=A0A9D3Y4P3_DREPO|nr:hypothetical protein DPMN_193112 [Dreissena polymorpha]
MVAYAACSIFNYTVVTPAQTEGGFVVNLTTTSEPDLERFQANDTIAYFLETIERYASGKSTCKPGTEFNLGKGVIQQYGINKFKRQAMLAVNRANLMTRVWKNASRSLLDSEYFLYSQVRNMVEGDPDVFAAGNCYDYKEYKGRYLFCPFAYRTENGSINVKDLSVEYDYLGNGSDWFFEARQNAKDVAKFAYTYGKFM